MNTTFAANGTEFDRALLGNQCWLELAGSGRRELAVNRWTCDATTGDELLLDRCTGPTLDVGCGPGRLAAALVDRGVISLGIDTSPTAVTLTRRRGGNALHRDVFNRIPAEGRWKHALLADGNIGIGGDPINLLRRISQLLEKGGSVLIELESPGQGIRHEQVRLCTANDRPGKWFTWSWLGIDALDEVAQAARLEISWTAHEGARWFAELARP